MPGDDIGFETHTGCLESIFDAAAGALSVVRREFEALLQHGVNGTEGEVG